MLMDEGRHLRDYYDRAEARGHALEVTINNGVDPAVYFAAVTPASAAPIDQDELGIASALRGRSLDLVPGRMVAVEAVADAQIVIEGGDPACGARTRRSLRRGYRVLRRAGRSLGGPGQGHHASGHAHVPLPAPRARSVQFGGFDR